MARWARAVILALAMAVMTAMILWQYRAVRESAMRLDLIQAWGYEHHL